jgi:enolase-phosphatase E1
MSYARIATALERSPSEVLFVSDVGAELDAALTAGMRTALCVRTPESAPSGSAHRVIHGFDQLSASSRA